MANSFNCRLTERAAALLAALEPLPPLGRAASRDAAQAWLEERQRRAVLERLTAGLPVDAGAGLLPAEISAALGDVARGVDFARPLARDEWRIGSAVIF